MPTNTDHALSEAYTAKDTSYYSNARVDYVDLLPADSTASILELGCGNGATGALALENGKAGVYVGIELLPDMADEAKRHLTTVHQGDVERIDLPYSAGTFDALILSEVLEHLINPDAVVRRLATFLKPGALVFASSPNISHWKNIASLAKGQFQYTESGMMDRTHLRWFTPSSFTRLFEDADVVVDRVAPLNHLNRFERVLGKTRLAPLIYFQINMHGHYRPRAKNP